MRDKTSAKIIWVKASKSVVSTIIGNFNALDILRQQLTKFQSSDLIGGDFNCRVRTEPDFITEDEHDFPFLPEEYKLGIMNSLTCLWMNMVES